MTYMSTLMTDFIVFKFTEYNEETVDLLLLVKTIILLT